MSVSSTTAPYTLPRYTRQWVYTFLVLAAAFTLYFRFQHPPVTTSPKTQADMAVPQESFWFFVVQLPNPAADYSPSAFHSKATDWFNALRRAGFHPMLLSDVRDRLTKGMLLPEKTIVLSIDEALLTTVQAYEPLLKDFKIPVTLTTALKPLNEGDRGYLSLNAVQKLPASGAWDVILIDEAAPPRLLTYMDIPITLALQPKISPWSSNLEASLANQLTSLRRPRRLSIDWQWSGQDLVNRLRSETPVHPNGSLLGVEPIRNRLWGIVLSKADTASGPFSLQAAPDQRAADISWAGTRGVEDFQLDFSIAEATGQVWFLLRSTGERGGSIRVGFYDGKVIVREHIAGQMRLLGMTDWPGVFPWKGTIQLQGSELRIARRGQTIMVSRVHHRPSRRSPSLMQFMVYDQLYGAAEVKDVALSIMPLLNFETETEKQ